MTIVIDGHNLIPRIPGIDLSDPDDEEKLIGLLQEYCRVRRKKIEVFFDGAQAGWAGVQRYGLVKAHFVRVTNQENDADRAIIAYLTKLKKGAKNITVVSSDREVAAASRSMQAEVISSEEFAKQLQKLKEHEPELDPRQQRLTEDEIKEWAQLFARGSEKDRTADK